jgi:hypothetical protein
MPPSSPSPSVPPECSVFQKDVGAWDVALSIRMGPGDPQESQGVALGRLVSGGRWLVVEFRNETTGFEGHGVYGWDAVKQRYVGNWVDDMRPFMAIGEGTWDEGTRTMTWLTDVPGPDGNPMRLRETMQAVSDDEKSYRVFVPGPAGDFEMMTAKYTRKR